MTFTATCDGMTFTGTCDGIDFCLERGHRIANSVTSNMFKIDRLVVIINNVNPVRSDLTVRCFPCQVIVMNASPRDLERLF